MQGPLKPTIDAGRFRVPCASCDGEVSRGQPRLGEPVNDGRVPNAKYRYHHFECALEREPRLLRAVLLSENFQEGLIPDPSSLNGELQDRLDALEEGRPLPPRRQRVDRDPRLDQLIGELQENLGDRDILTVLADVLSERGDPRGELIVLDLALGDSEGSEAQEDRRRSLRSKLAPRICRPEHARAEVAWGIGFIERAVVREWQPYFATPFRDLWTHGSFGVLRELVVGSRSSDWLVSPMPALRSLTVAGGTLDQLPSLPRLEELVLSSSVRDAGSVEMLATMLDGRKLSRIAVDARLARPEVYGRLAALCDRLDAA